MAAAKASRGDETELPATRRSPMAKCAHLVAALAVAGSAVRVWPGRASGCAECS